MKKLVFLLTLFSSNILLACPYCAGTTQSGKDVNTTAILAGFIVAIYIPYFVIYRLIKKQRSFKIADDHSGPA